MKICFLLLAMTFSTALAANDPVSLSPDLIGRLPVDDWTTYSGDYSGQRFSPLTQINQSNVKNLGLAWVSPLGYGQGVHQPAAHYGPGTPETIVGGEIDTAVPVRDTPRVSGGILQVNGILYVSVPDNAWAVDACTGT